MAINWVLKKGETTAKETGVYTVLNMKRRPKTHLTDEQKNIIKQAYSESFLGAKLLRYYIKAEHHQDIPQNKIHKYILESGLAKADPTKQKKRKRCRYERDHSFSLIHFDWREYDGKQVIAYEDDASRKILSIGEFDNATHRGETIHRPMARLEDLFRHRGNTGIDSSLLTNLKNGIMTDYTVH